MTKHENSPYLSELQSIPFLPPEKIKTLREENMYKFYFSTILRAENILYGRDRNSRIHKLVFLVGGPENDVSVATDENGKSIYKDQPNYPKLPEIPETSAAISDYFMSIHDNKPDPDLISGNLVRVMTEISDVFHNLIELTMLDNDYEKSYKNDCINPLVKALGLPNGQFSIGDGMLLAYTKYRERLINAQGKKNNQNENELIKQAITPNAGGKALIRTPTKEALACTFRQINEISTDVLIPRLRFIKTRPGWDKHLTSINPRCE